MKILIVGVQRTGTGSLSNSFKKHGYKLLGEPFNELNGPKKYPLIELKQQKNIVVKTIVSQIPKEYSNDNWEEFILEFIKEFDKIIWLDRKDTEDHFLSKCHLIWRTIYKSNPHGWLQRYHISDIPIDFIQNYEHIGGKHQLIQHKEMLNNVVTKFNFNITWYEDLYGEDRNKSLEIIKSWNIPNLNYDELNKQLHPSNRLRQKEKVFI